MTSLYNCRHDGDQFRITKFDSDFNVGSSYLCTAHECECPAGSRDTCRHRQMLPKFLSRGLSAEWFYDFDRGGWVRMALPGTEPGGDREGVGVGDREQASVADWKLHDELPHEHDKAQLAIYRAGADYRRGR